MEIDNQKKYWDNVAGIKTFTHPVDLELIEKHINRRSKILDFGCGYGRVVKILSDSGFKNIVGYDTSKELITRGINLEEFPLFHIENSCDLPIEDNSIDCVILFAVLTCIPSNQGQIEIIKILHSKLKSGGVIYISDYYLQDNSPETERYDYLSEDESNYGVFTLKEGVTFRHHTKEWMSTLLKDFKILVEKPLQVMTMNGHIATGFQIIGQK